MTINRIRILLLYALAVATLLSGCVSVDLPISSPISATATFPWIPTRSPTSIPTIAFTLAPTLSANDAYASLKGLLNDSSCRLPCWMGMMPGQSTLTDVNEQLTTFSGIAERVFLATNAGAGSYEVLTIPQTEDEIVIEVGSSYITSSDGNIVTVIGIITRAYKLLNGQFTGDVYGYSAYNELLKLYTISEVLSSYGSPEQIYIVGYLRNDTSVTPGFGDHFDIHLWYPDQGMFLEYKMSVEGSGNTYHFCPSNAFVSGYLIESGLSAGYQEILLSLDNKYQYFFTPSIYVKPPEEAFGMTDEEFYQRIITSPESCFETPKAIWWP